MKIYLSILLTIFLLISSCNSKIKDKTHKVEVEKGTEIKNTNVPNKTTKKDINQDVIVSKSNKKIGFWVGFFKEDNEEHYGNKNVYVDEGYMWNRENKINISIDKITDSIVIGHSVVAGNNRPFKGLYKNNTFTLKEPGDNKYDGTFIFKIIDNKLIGKWTAYKNIDIKKRKYTLEKKIFTYNPNIMLEEAKEYINWNKVKVSKEKFEIEEGEFEEWIKEKFASATELIYKVNASNTILTKKDVENLKKGDLTIIRNTIYARHGYSFKNRPLRVFFDAQSWYIPVFTNIKKEFTDIEKENIKLLLRYEKNAMEYYDYFGRG